MFVEGKIKALCKGIIVEYAHYMRDAVKQGRKEYIETGIDGNIQVYKALFLDILGVTLGITHKELEVDKVVKEEVTELLKNELSIKKYQKISGGYNVLIYSTCELIFDKVIQEIEGGKY